MLRWAESPTKCFNDLLDYAFELMICDVDNAIDDLKSGLIDTIDDAPIVANFYEGELHYFESLDVLKKALLDLQEGHNSDKLYMPTDWQFFILDRMIKGVCIYIDDMACDLYSKASRKKYGFTDSIPSFITKRKHVLKVECEYDMITLRYFWDLDHDIYLSTYGIVPHFTEGCEDLTLVLYT